MKAHEAVEAVQVAINIVASSQGNDEERKALLEKLSKIVEALGPCRKCNGTGKYFAFTSYVPGYRCRFRKNGGMVYEYACKHCSGTGQVLEEKCASCAKQYLVDLRPEAQVDEITDKFCSTCKGKWYDKKGLVPIKEAEVKKPVKIIIPRPQETDPEGKGQKGGKKIGKKGRKGEDEG